MTEWVFQWSHGKNEALRKAVFDAGSRLRESRLPLYIVHTADEQRLRDIFYRTNHFGKRLTWDEVHDALFGFTGDSPSTMGDLALELAGLGMGRPDEGLLLPCLVAFRGLDATRSVGEHYQRSPDVMRSAVREALPAVRGALSFLKRYVEIPHLRLLPRSTALPVLTRFFALHPEPKARTAHLLSRWVWRAILEPGAIDERNLLRKGVASIVRSEEESVQLLLALLPRVAATEYSLPDRFDARGADSRLAMLGLASLRPVDLDSGRELIVADAIEHSISMPFGVSLTLRHLSRQVQRTEYFFAGMDLRRTKSLTRQQRRFDLPR